MSNHTKRCPVCETLFFPRRSDAVYCSARCRQRAKRGKINRAKNEEQSLYRQAERAISDMRMYDAQRQLRIIALGIISELPDSEREKLYDQIETDFYRVKRDKSVTYK